MYIYIYIKNTFEQDNQHGANKFCIADMNNLVLHFLSLDLKTSKQDLGLKS